MTSDKQFEELMESVNSGILVIHNEKIVYANNYIAKRFGTPKSGLVGKHVLNFIHPDKSKEAKAKLKSMLYSKNPVLGFETDIINAKGETRIVEINSAPTNFKNTPSRIFSIKDITDMKNSEALIKKNETKFKSFFEDSLVGSYISTPKGILLDCNQAFVEIIGYPNKKTALATNVKNIYDKATNRDRKIERLRKHEKIYQHKEEIVRYDGEKIFVMSNIWGEYDSDGSLEFIQGFTQNITEQVTAEKGMRESEKRYRALSENTPVGVWHADLNGIVTYINPKLSEISGLTSDEATGGKWGTKVHPEDKERVEKEWDDYIVGEKPYTSTYRFVHDNGETRCVLENATTILNDKKEKVGHIGTVTDITERIASEEKLKDSEEKYHTLFDHANDAIFIMKDDTFIDCNKKTCEMFGVIEDEILNHAPYEFSPDKQPDGRNSKEKALEKINKAYDDKPQLFEWKHQKLNGEVFDAEVSLNTITIKNKKYLQAIVRDVSERKEHDTMIAENEQKYKDLVEKSEIAILIDDIDGRFKYFNNTFNKLYGYTAEEIKKKSIRKLVHKDDLPRVLKYHNNRLQGKKAPSDYTFRALKKDGTPMNLRVKAIPIVENDKIIGTRSYIWDITENLKIRKKLEDSEKKFRSSLEQINLLALMLDSNGIIIFANDYLLKKTGWKRKEVIGKNYFDVFVSKDIRPRSKQRFKEIIESKNTYANRTNEMFTKDGERLIIEWNVTAQFSDSGELFAATSFGTDITEKLKAEANLRFQSELINQSYESMLTTDKDFKIRWTNKAFTKLFGYTKEEVLGKTPDFLNAEHLADDIQQGIYESVKAGKLIRTNLLNKKKDGSTFVCELSVYPVTDSSGNVIAYAGHQYDVTEKVTAQKRLEETMERLRLSTESSRIGIWDWDLVENNLIWDERMYEIYGISPDKFGGAYEAWEKTVHPDDLENANAEVQAAIKGEKDFRTQFRAVWPSGETRYIEANAIVVRDENNNPVRMIGVNWDITDRKKTELSIQESEKKYRELFENQIEAYAYHEIILNKKGKPIDFKFIDVNVQFLRELNIKKKSDVIGKSIREVDPGIDTKWIKIYGEVAMLGKPKRFEDKFASNDKWYNIFAYSPRKGMFATSFIDITDEKIAEEELKKYKDHLEEMVEKRTTELQQKNKELDNALKVFVGRELTIKNLRNEISKLEKEIKKLKN